MISNEEKILSYKITEHLKLKEEKRDDLNGIVLAIYETEIEELSDKIIKSLSYLISRGFISESISTDGRSYYKLIKEQRLIFKDILLKSDKRHQL